MQNEGMAEIKLARTAGFCWGVKRAIDITMDAAQKSGQPVYTYGPLIHNPQLIKLLETKNVRIATEINNIDSGEVIIRTHGITPQKRAEIKRKNLSLNDATCPLVARVQGMIKKYSHKGYTIIIVGDDHHAEIIGLKGYAVTPVHVVATMEEAEKLPDYEKVFLCAQTTCDMEKYRRISGYLKGRYKNLEIGETICDATSERQDEVIRLSKEVDVMVVVGGKNSANTTRLASIAKEAGIPSIHIETADELDLDKLLHYPRIGVTAGASTPQWIIDNVVRALGTLEERSWFGIPLLGEALSFFVKSELFLAAGAAVLTYANLKLMGDAVSLPAMAVAFCAILSTYLFNRLLRPQSEQESKIRKYYYHLKYKNLFWGLAVTSLALGAVLSFELGTTPFLLFLTVIAFGAAYGVEHEKLPIFVQMKNIPASKDLLVGLAWVITTVVIPYLSLTEANHLIYAITYTMVIAYSRTVLYDIKDIYSDQIIGKEAMPTLVGRSLAKSLLYALLIMMSVSTLYFAVTSKETVFYAFISGIVYQLAFVYYNENKTLILSTRYDLFLDAQFYLVGVLVIFL